MRSPKPAPLTYEEVRQLLQLKVAYNKADGGFTCDACRDRSRFDVMRRSVQEKANLTNIVWLCDDCAGQHGLLW